MFKKLFLTSALLATFANAYAQQSQTFGMTGSVAPGACSVTLGTNAIIPLGTLTQSAVRAYGLGSTGTGAATYASTNPTVSFTVSCTATTRIALGFVDNNPGKNLLHGNVNDVLKFGIVDGSAGTSIGNFNVLITGVQMDGGSATQYYSALTGTTPTWVTTNILGSTGAGNNAAPGSMNGFSKAAGANVPETAKLITGTLATSNNFGKTIIDTMTTTLAPTGSTTLTLIYL